MKTTNNILSNETQRMTRVFVAYMLGTEPTWTEGDSVTFQFTFRNCNSTWGMTLRREESTYAPFAYALEGRQLTFEGQEPEYRQTWSRRYKTMEQAFLHIVNHMNENANIRDHYKAIGQWLNENNRTDSWI